MTKPEFTLRAVPAIADIPAAAWNVCANPAPRSTPAARIPAFSTAGRAEAGDAGLQVISENPQLVSEGPAPVPYNPFISHEFLASLEASKSAVARTGWQPQHLLAEAADGTLMGAAPCYLKSHSRGEYVFDRGWAEAYESAGGSYYPKLQVSVPFTPATGPRLLVRPGPQAEAVRILLVQGLVALCGQRGASSVHATFLPDDHRRVFAAQGFLERTDQQFHWFNDGYSTFDDFLAALAARKRKTIRRERRDARTSDVSVHWLTGADLTESAWDAFFAFYMDTGSRKWGRPYLTREFYSIIGETMRDRILLVMAKRAGRWIAGAINFIGSDTLYGRHWGAIEHHPFLHFELCYYQAIDYALAHRLKCVEAGAQGEHKLARGYRPVTTFSAHFIADPGLRRAVADYLRRERAYVEAAGQELAAMTPFRKNLADEAEE